MNRARTLAFIVLSASVLSSCTIIDDLVTYELEVVNHCGGGNYTVAFYFDDAYQRDITLSHTFTGISRGQHHLEAYGTGSGGTYFSDWVDFEQDWIWVLCPSVSAQASQLQHPDDYVQQEEGKR